jgi:type II secretory pathway component PulC
VLINGQTLAVGETVEGARVLKIEKDQVTLEWKGRTKILMMDGS